MPIPITARLLLLQAIQKELRLKRIFSALLCLLGGVFVLLFLYKSWLLTILGAIGFITGGVLIYIFLNQNSTKNPLIHLLDKEPERIVWVYSVVTQRMPFGIRFTDNSVFYFKLIDGTDVTLGVAQTVIPIISVYLNKLLPHATFGYTQDKEQWYMVAPELLLRYED